MEHFRRFDSPPLPLGKSSITYTVFDDTSFPEPIKASVTVIHQHQDGVGLEMKYPSEALGYPNPANAEIHILPGYNFYRICNKAKIIQSILHPDLKNIP